MSVKKQINHLLVFATLAVIAGCDSPKPASLVAPAVAAPPAEPTIGLTATLDYSGGAFRIRNKDDFGWVNCVFSLATKADGIQYSVSIQSIKRSASISPWQ